MIADLFKQLEAAIENVESAKARLDSVAVEYTLAQNSYNEAVAQAREFDKQVRGEVAGKLGGDASGRVRTS